MKAFQRLPRQLAEVEREFKDMNNQGSKVFNLVLPAGDGTIWIKSVTTTAN